MVVNNRKVGTSRHRPICRQCGRKKCCHGPDRAGLLLRVRLKRDAQRLRTCKLGNTRTVSGNSREVYQDSFFGKVLWATGKILDLCAPAEVDLVR